MTGRFLLASLAFIGGFFFLGIKLLHPTPLVIWSTGTDYFIQSSYLGDIFTITDVITIVIASLLVSVSALYLALYDRMRMMQDTVLQNKQIQQMVPDQPSQVMAPGVSETQIPMRASTYSELSEQLHPTPLEERKARWEAVIPTLKEDQQIIYQTVLDEDGMMAQSDIVEKTGLSKSNVSRTLDILESMGLVERRRRGMGNIIMLK
jgi:DNA-binding transcriptional ArsR family regulator